jgi:hypothetical protein
MTRKILAEKNGWISIIDIEKSTRSYLVVRYVMATKPRKVFIAEQGREWDLFDNVEEAIRWIKE